MRNCIKLFLWKSRAFLWCICIDFCLALRTHCRSASTDDMMWMKSWTYLSTSSARPALKDRWHRITKVPYITINICLLARAKIKTQSSRTYCFPSQSLKLNHSYRGCHKMKREINISFIQNWPCKQKVVWLHHILLYLSALHSTVLNLS